MRCKECNGTGRRFVPTNKNAITGNGYTADCPFCNGTGEIEVTNEEWFCSLTTEEKAEFSMRVFKNCTWCLDGGSPQECPFNEFSEHCPAESKENMMKWLKEKHE